jgi:hypothetical protein
MATPSFGGSPAPVSDLQKTTSHWRPLFERASRPKSRFPRGLCA